MRIPAKLSIPILIIVFLVVLIFLLSHQPFGGRAEQIQWGAAFSKPFAQKMELDWKATYLATLDDLKVKHLRMPLYWSDIEPVPGEYKFDDYDWMIDQAEKRDVKLILVIGRKLPRWPECHIPDWAKSLKEKEQQKKILDLISAIVERYKQRPNLYLWQVENEPFLPFGECPKLDTKFLEKEIKLVHSLDSKHQVMITDSGELSIWVRAVKRADVFGTTMYRIVWSDWFGYVKYPLPPKFFWLKANIVYLLYPNKKIIVSELQAEPWGPKLLYESPLSEQKKSMDLKQFEENIEYAKEVGFPEVYLWGAEWWYWLKIKHNNDRYWEKAKELFKENKSF